MQRFDSISTNILFHRFSADLPLHLNLNLNQNEIHYLRQTFEAEAVTVRKNVSHLNAKKARFLHSSLTSVHLKKYQTLTNVKHFLHKYAALFAIANASRKYTFFEKFTLFRFLKDKPTLFCHNNAFYCLFFFYFLFIWFIRFFFHLVF